MSKSKKKKERQSPRGSSATTAAAPSSGESRGDILVGLLRGSIVLLVVARWLVPTEATDDGETLWLTQCVLGAGLLWVWSMFRGGPSQIRFGMIDAAVAMLVLGHVVSGGSLFITGGDRRAAINIVWEWFALGLSFFLIRQVLFSRADARRLMLVLWTTTVVLAGLGIWQHYVFYPQASRDYDLKREELDRLHKEITAAAPQERSAKQVRIREIETDFYHQGIPLEGPARQLYEQRLRSSTEPFGLFALANSFAGLLLPGIFVGLSALVGSRARPSNSGTTAILGISLLLLLFCLVLTKSRTAWVGLAAGVTLWGLLSLWRGSGAKSKRGIAWIAGLLAVVVLLGGLAFAGGAIDLAVISEAPKSLRYRLQYWQGGAEVLRESPIFGIGPGNFRQHYLKYKLPDSSEEIADPHNFLLDLWANGGLLAVAGLCGFLAIAAASVRPADSGARGETPSDANGNPATERAASETATGGNVIFLGGAAAIPFLIATNYFTGQSADHRLVALWFAWCLTAPLLFLAVRSPHEKQTGREFSETLLLNLSPACLVSATFALMVHLSGAGGIEMPAIVQTLFLLAIGACVFGGREGASRSFESRAGFWLASGLITVAFGACLVTATLPVTTRNGLMGAGDAEFSIGRSENAQSFYREAAEADPFSPEPLEKLAELSFFDWQKESPPSQATFDAGVEFSRLAMAADPFDPYGHWRLGEWHLRKFEQSKDPQDVSAAIDELNRAVERYPNNTRLRGLRAFAFSKGGRKEEAQQEAAVALELHRINRLAGHNDKCLPTKKELADMGESAASQGPTAEEIQQLAEQQEGP